MSAETDPGPAWALVEMLAAPEATRRMRAVAQLRALGRSAVPALERGLANHSRDGVRRWCAHLLADGGYRGVAAAIVGATHDRTAAVRLLALRTLADPLRSAAFGLDPVPHLVRLARFDRSKRVRRTALRALRLRLPDPRAAAALAAEPAHDRTAAGPMPLHAVGIAAATGGLAALDGRPAEGRAVPAPAVPAGTPAWGDGAAAGR